MKRTMGDPQTKQVDPGAGQLQVYYTAPNAKLEELGLTELTLGSRQWLDINGLNLLRSQLHLVEPNLEPWLQSVWDLASRDGIRLPFLEPLAPDKMGLVITSYNPLDDLRFAEVLSVGLDWKTLVMEYLGGTVPLYFNGADRFQGQFNLLGDVRNIGYDKEKAIALLTEMGYKDLNLTLLIPQDTVLEKIGERIQTSLELIGIHAVTTAVPETEIKNTIQSLLDQRAFFITISLR